MRALIWADMEGVSQITDHRECWTVFPEYWQTGRRKFTADVVAAASGLLDGGANEVVVINGHGLGWPNLLEDELPERVRLYESGMSYGEFDAFFQVGFHARCGTASGFISHTYVPNFRLAVDDALVTESHIFGWSVGLPLLGVTGDSILDTQLDGALAGTPFLAVKRSTSRTETTPLFITAEASSNAIREFARRSAQGWRGRKAPALPPRFTVAASLDPNLTQHAVGQYGLRQSSAAVLTVEAADWGEADPAVWAAVEAALRPFLVTMEDLDLSSEDAMYRQKGENLERARRYFIDWVHSTTPAWQD